MDIGSLATRAMMNSTVSSQLIQLNQSDQLKYVEQWKRVAQLTQRAGVAALWHAPRGSMDSFD